MDAHDYLKAIRAHKLTQEQIAARTGIGQSTISKIERGVLKDVMSRRFRALQSLYEELQSTSPAPQPTALAAKAA